MTDLAGSKISIDGIIVWYHNIKFILEVQLIWIVKGINQVSVQVGVWKNRNSSWKHASHTMKKKLTGSAHHWHPAVRTQFLHCLCMKHLSRGCPRENSPMNTHSIWMIRCMSATERCATCYALHLSGTHSHIISRTGNFVTFHWRIQYSFLLHNL